MKLTTKELDAVEKLKALSLPYGEVREIYKCQTCGRIQAHDYIPYGIGRGRWYGMCNDNAVSSNWIFRQAIKIGEPIKDEESHVKSNR